MNAESATAIAEILLRLDARLEKIEAAISEMRAGEPVLEAGFSQTPGRAIQGWDRYERQVRMGEL